MTDGGASNGARLRGETLPSSIMKPEGPEDCPLIRPSDPTEESRSVGETQRTEEDRGGPRRTEEDRGHVITALLASATDRQIQHGVKLIFIQSD